MQALTYRCLSFLVRKMVMLVAFVSQLTQYLSEITRAFSQRIFTERFLGARHVTYSKWLTRHLAPKALNVSPSPPSPNSQGR